MNKIYADDEKAFKDNAASIMRGSVMGAVAAGFRGGNA